MKKEYLAPAVTRIGSFKNVTRALGDAAYADLFEMYAWDTLFPF